MAGTQTTVLVQGEPKTKEAELNGTINTSDALHYVAGSVGSVEQLPAGGTPDAFMVARESLDVEYGGSFTGTTRVNYYVPEPGDELMVKVGGSNTTINPGDVLTAPVTNIDDGALSVGGNGSLAVAKEKIDASGGGTVEHATIEVEAI